jgi:AraC-like DNA-binding protein
MPRVTNLAPITACVCGRDVARVAGVDPALCPHTPTSALAVSTTGATASPLAASVRALEQALDWLTRPSTACACARGLIGDLDPDPDCPGLTEAGDGCRADGRIRAWAALESVGLTYGPQSLRTEQLTVAHALAHARHTMTTPSDRAALAERAATVIIAAARPRPAGSILDLRDQGLTFAQIAAALGYRSASNAHTAYRRALARTPAAPTSCTAS